MELTLNYLILGGLGKKNLLSLWEEVRNNDVRITEKLVIDWALFKGNRIRYFYF